MREADRGNERWAINIMRANRLPERAALDMLADIETWFRRALPHYRNSWSLKAKAQGIRAYTKATYALIEEFFVDCKEQNMEIPRSALTAKSDIEHIIEGR
ncbi:hypothetical protein LCGC14_0716210 [marine sediment metagenome]|uniref:Uncharacterized protein n=1 Tax=marine sediment metagenome TaxID=412755 RepID=A0A0F9QYU6_9ZZZZ